MYGHCDRFSPLLGVCSFHTTMVGNLKYCILATKPKLINYFIANFIWARRRFGLKHGKSIF